MKSSYINLSQDLAKSLNDLLRCKSRWTIYH